MQVDVDHKKKASRSRPVEKIGWSTSTSRKRQVEKGRSTSTNRKRLALVVDVDHCLFLGRRQAAFFITPQPRRVYLKVIKPWFKRLCSPISKTGFLICSKFNRFFSTHPSISQPIQSMYVTSFSSFTEENSKTERKQTLLHSSTISLFIWGTRLVKGTFQAEVLPLSNS